MAAVRLLAMVTTISYYACMNKTLLAGVVILLIVIVALFLYVTPRETTAPTGPSQQETVRFDGRNATFSVEGTLVTLVGGLSQTSTASGSATQVVTRYFGIEATGDLNGDGLADAAFLITQESGGSGLFYYVVAALQKANGYTTTNAFLIGDRIAPQAVSISVGAQELQVNYAERKPGEPMTADPSAGATLRLKVTPTGILERVTG